MEFSAEVAKTVVPVWRTVVSGLTRDQLVAGAEAKGRDVSAWARDIIAGTAVTSGIAYRLMVIGGEEFATDEERTDGNIRAVAKTRGYPNPPAEVAFLLAQFTQEELGYRRLVVMHDPISDPINDYDGRPGVLVVYRGDADCEWLNVLSTDSTDQFLCKFAFVFLAPEGVEA